MLESLLHHKKEAKEYLAALVVSEDRIDAALWEQNRDGQVTIIKTASQSYGGEWEKAIDAADSAITEIESGLPTDAELTKVVFGLFPEWLSEDHIKETYLKHLKQLTVALSLTPLGFVELPTAVAHLLHKDEGTQQTVILVGMENKHVTISLFKIGKLIGSTTIVRSHSINQDVEKGLSSFADVEVLPSRMLLYGTLAELEPIKAEMLTYPWQQKANFLHFPKIEALSVDYPVKAVAAASATELTPHPQDEPAEAVSPAAASQSVPLAAPEARDEVEEIAKDLGFVTEKETAQENAGDQEATMAVDDTDLDEVENIEPVMPTQTNNSKNEADTVDIPSARPGKSKKLAFSMPQLSFSFKLPPVPKIGLIVAIVAGLLIIGSTAALAVWLLPRATVTVLVQPKVFDKTETITIRTDATSVDTDAKVLPGKVQKLEVNGSQTVATSGKKTIGDKAKGEVTIFNKTLNTKTFKKGTVLSSGKLTFMLDNDTTVTSASDSGVSLTYGTVKATITAGAIGSASNVGASSDFSFADLPTTSYTARNEKALSGGSSKEISVVSRDDQKAAREKAVTQLEKDAQDKLKAQIPAQEKLLDRSINSAVTSEKYSKEIGEEATEVTATIAVTITAATYSEADMNQLLDTIITANIPKEYEYNKENNKITIEEITMNKDGTWVFKPHLTVELLPKVAVGSFAKDIAGKSIAQASEYLKSQPGVAGISFNIGTPIPFMPNKLPVNFSHITLDIKPL